jgi:hypothetical protein
VNRMLVLARNTNNSYKATKKDRDEWGIAWCQLHCLPKVLSQKTSYQCQYFWVGYMVMEQPLGKFQWWIYLLHLLVIPIVLLTLLIVVDTWVKLVKGCLLYMPTDVAKNAFAWSR